MLVVNDGVESFVTSNMPFSVRHDCLWVVRANRRLFASQNVGSRDECHQLGKGKGWTVQG